MPIAKRVFRLLTQSGPLRVLAVVGMVLLGVAAPASAQLFPFFEGPSQRPQRGGSGWFGGNGFFAPFEQPRPRQQQRPVERQDYSRAPAPEKRETAAERNVLVLGDAMADWLAYGLENALSETPEWGVIRKHKTVSGLISYQPKGQPSDWAAAAKEILATEKPDVIVVMLGIHDRRSISEAAGDQKDAKDDQGKTDDSKAAEADDDSDASSDKSSRQGGVHRFHDERWAELYTRKIDEMIAVLKTKGVPVVWVGLPAVRGTKSTADALFLDSLYREAAGRAGITYVDVWDGFVDEAGRYVLQGPDFEGQTRRLRSYDGVFFTKAGARKLAHYVEREISRIMAGRSTLIEIPADSGTPDDTNAAKPEASKPQGPPPRPIAGPIMPLVASSVGTDELLGGPTTRQAAADPQAKRALTNGDALAAPAGRADDFAWPRREMAHEKAGDPVVAVAAPADNSGREGAGTAAAEKPKKRHAVRPPSDPRVARGENGQRRIYVQRPQMMPSGPVEWLSRLFQ